MAKGLRLGSVPWTRTGARLLTRTSLRRQIRQTSGNVRLGACKPPDLERQIWRRPRRRVDQVVMRFDFKGVTSGEAGLPLKRTARGLVLSAFLERLEMCFERGAILMFGLEFCLQLLYEELQAANLVAQLLNVRRGRGRGWHGDALCRNGRRRGGSDCTRRR